MEKTCLWYLNFLIFYVIICGFCWWNLNYVIGIQWFYNGYNLVDWCVVLWMFSMFKQCLLCFSLFIVYSVSCILNCYIVNREERGGGLALWNVIIWNTNSQRNIFQLMIWFLNTIFSAWTYSLIFYQTYLFIFPYLGLLFRSYYSNQFPILQNFLFILVNF